MDSFANNFSTKFCYIPARNFSIRKLSNFRGVKDETSFKKNENICDLLLI